MIFISDRSWSFPSYNSAHSSCAQLLTTNLYAIKPFLPLHYSGWDLTWSYAYFTGDGSITIVSSIQFTCVVAYFPSAHNSLCGRRVFSIMIRFGILAIQKTTALPHYTAPLFVISNRIYTWDYIAALQNLNCQNCAAALSLYIGHKISANSDAINGTAPLMRAPQNRTSNICNNLLN